MQIDTVKLLILVSVLGSVRDVLSNYRSIICDPLFL